VHVYRDGVLVAKVEIPGLLVLSGTMNRQGLRPASLLWSAPLRVAAGFQARQAASSGGILEQLIEEKLL